MKPFTPKTITDARRVMQQLATVYEQGYASDSEEITRGIICIAAPVFGPQEAEGLRIETNEFAFQKPLP